MHLLERRWTWSSLARSWHLHDPVVGLSHKHSPALRRRLRVKAFYHQGSKICRSTFLILHGIGKTLEIKSRPVYVTWTFLGKTRFQSLKDHYQICGLTARQHGNSKRLPYNTLTQQEQDCVIRFIKSYARANSILLPGRIPGYKRDDLQLLPSSTTKKVSVEHYMEL